MPLPQAALLDTSVLLRFAFDHGDLEQRPADRLRETVQRGAIGVVLLDLSLYEFVNVLARKLGYGGDQVAAQVDLIWDFGFSVLAVDRDLARSAGRIAARTGLSGYDAAFVAASIALAVPLITGDRKLADAAAGADIRLLGNLYG